MPGSPCSEYARRSLVEYTGGDAVLIPNGVDCSAYAGDETLPGRARGSSTLMFLGRIDEPRKGLPTLLAALPRVVASVPDLSVLVAGPGDVDEVRSGMDPELAARVEFLGLVSEEDKARALRSADIYVAPNTGGESFGIILLEAMAAGAPVVASDIEAFQRVLDEGRAGVHFRNEDPEDLAARLIALLGDPVRRDALRAAGSGACRPVRLGDGRPPGAVGLRERHARRGEGRGRPVRAVLGPPAAATSALGCGLRGG